MNQLQTITLGGGCFWCTEAVYVKVRGVTDVESGYSNGQLARPSYEDVCSGRTGSNEVVKLVYDPASITLKEILEIFFVIHDPTTPEPRHDPAFYRQEKKEPPARVVQRPKRGQRECFQGKAPAARPA